MTGVIWPDLFFSSYSEHVAAKSISGLGRPHYTAVAMIEEKHEERIDHHLKVILAQIIPQSSNKSNCQHSLFACLYLG